MTVLSMIFMQGHKFFDEEKNLSILQALIENYNCFETEQSNYFIICMGEMLSRYNYSFISNNFVVILDCLITLLKLISNQKDKTFA